jgi:hypothetical protein
MALIVRIDVDRPYGKHPAWRHILSRAASDLYFPPLEQFGYLKELEKILRLLNERSVRAHVFFRRCTTPSPRIRGLLKAGAHEIGLHLENSRSFESFQSEKSWLERETGITIRTFSKHGSGGARFGRRHYAPYEPDKYAEWARRSSMRAFLGNDQDPTIAPEIEDGLHIYPSAFWLEPHWRDVNRFDVAWLSVEVATHDIVLLIHPENVLEDSHLTAQFAALVSTLPTRLA